METASSSSLREKILKSDAVDSLRQESEVYSSFLDLGFQVNHSPYFTDEKSGKLREVDVSARKYWTKQINNSFRSISLSFIVECKSISNYQIIATNNSAFEYGLNLESKWVGDDWINNYSKIVETLSSYNASEEDVVEILKELNKYCFPNGMVRYAKDSLTAFKIPTYNSFRETNIGNTKDNENSVVWKAYQSLYSCLNSFESLNWQNFETELDDSINEHYLRHKSEFDKEVVLEILRSQADHLTYLHPVLVLESRLWELKDSDITERKYIRLVFKELFGEETWIDVVSMKYLNEYIQNSKEYDFKLSENGYKSKTLSISK